MAALGSGLSPLQKSFSSLLRRDVTNLCLLAGLQASEWRSAEGDHRTRRRPGGRVGEGGRALAMASWTEVAQRVVDWHGSTILLALSTGWVLSTRTKRKEVHR